MKRLLNDNAPLPLTALDHYMKKPGGNEKRFKIYNSIIREYMWCGRYSLAASMLKTLNRSFRASPSNELMMMKRIFMEKQFRGYD